MPLFPELREDTDAVARAERILVARRESWQERRNYIAMKWRGVRRDLHSLPRLARAGVEAYWDRGPLPRSHEYLAGIVAGARKGVSYWHKLAELRRFHLISQGRLPNPWVR